MPVTIPPTRKSRTHTFPKSVFFIGVFALGALAATISAPPATPPGNTADTIQGVKVADPYRWLENSADAKVKAWSDAENARTRAYLDALPARAAVKDRLTKLITASSPAYSALLARGAHVFARYTDPAKQQPMIITLDAKASPASRKMLLDPNALDPGGHTSIDWFVPSNDGAKLAASLSKNGSEDGTLHIYDVATGKEEGEPIDRVQYPTAGGSMAWAADNKGFWYTRYPGAEVPEADRHFYLQVYFHKLGTPVASDTLALGKADGLERVSEIFLDNRGNRAEIMAMVQRGDGNIWAFFVLKQGAPALQVGTYDDKIVYATIGPDGGIYGVSRNNSSNGRIVKLAAPYTKLALAKAPVIVPESNVAIVSGGAEEQQADLNFDPHHLFVRDIIGGPIEVRVFDLTGKPQGKLPLPEVASNNEIVSLSDAANVLYSVATYVKPRYYARWNPATGKAEDTDIKQTSPISWDDAEVRRVFATSKDGTKIPVSVILKKGTKLEGNNPLLLYGYGGFGINQSPGFLSATDRLWLDAGGIYAIANIRGGSEYGEKWHEQGMLLNKQNVFDDFAAAAQYLIDTHYTSHEKLALLGGSNGGLLMGAVITQHPGLARAVVSSVGIYDMVRTELDPNGAFNTTEYGSVKDPAQFKALYAYSPYHHVDKGARYPSVLMMTGANDGRVNPMHSRKFTAELQADSTSGLPILLRTSDTSGHGIGSSLNERIAQQTDLLTFYFDQLGMTYPPK